MSKSHSAAASLAGYLYQARYALLRGLEEGRRHPSHSISIEKFDDIAFEEDGKPIELIQTKHHANGGDVSDNSVDLWKTLGIWTQRTRENPTVTANTRLVFLTTSTCRVGSALSALRMSSESRNEEVALDILETAARNSRNKVTERARAAFLELPTAARVVLVRNIWVFDRAPNISNVRSEIELLLHYSAPPAQVSTLTDYLEGWWLNQVVIALRGASVSEIPLRTIEQKVSELRESFKVENLLVDEAIEGMPPLTELPQEDRMLIRQMKLIRIKDAELRGAVHDYYRAFEQRSRWARENLLLDGEVDRYDRKLHDAWDRYFLSRTSDADASWNEQKKETRGREVFRWSRQYQEPLRNRNELWLSSGSYQMLSDQLRVGWHPDFEMLLAAREEQK